MNEFDNRIPIVPEVERQPGVQQAPPAGTEQPPQPDYTQPVANQPVSVPGYYKPPTPEQAAKKDIRHRALYCAVPLLILQAGLFFWSNLYFYIMSFFGYSKLDAYEIIKEPAIGEIVQILLSMLLFTVPFSIACRMSGRRISDAVPLNKPPKKLILPFFLFGLAFCAFANIAVSYAGSIFEGFGINYPYSEGEIPAGIFGFLLSVVTTAILPALVEEFACRGVVFDFLKEYGEGFAIIATAVLFGIMHGNFNQIPFAFLVGLVLSYIRAKSGSLWICCAVHGVNNLFSVILSYVELSSAAANAVQIIVFSVCMLAGIAALLITGREKEIFSIQNTETALKEGQKYYYFFTSPLVILFIAFCLFEAFMYFFL